MKVLTAEQMREVDRKAIAAGISGLDLMECAGTRVVEFLELKFSPLAKERVVVVCGKGNNGGDGLVVARQLCQPRLVKSLHVVLASDPSEFRGDAARNWRRFQELGLEAHCEITPEMRDATIVVDALLGTGLDGPARGKALDWIHAMNREFPHATIVSADTPSGLHDQGESVKAHYTITFVAPKLEQVVPPTCDRTGVLRIVDIGTPLEILERNPAHNLELVTPAGFRRLLAPRARAAHKGSFGHVLVIGGAAGKGGAAAMTGYAALKAGAGLVTVACADSERPAVTSLAPELMSQQVTEDPGDKDVLAIGPGLGTDPEWRGVAQRLFAQSALPVVLDADGLNAVAGTPFRGPGPFRVLTPHPGEMARIAAISTSDVQADRIGVARRFAQDRNVAVVLKGQRTVIAFPDGRAFINPTGTPAMATAGSGDILTGLIAGLLAQWPDRREQAVLAAVWLHGRAAEIGAVPLTELCLTATDILRYLPEAVREAAV